MEGILLLNKPKGMTSHDCVFKVRKLIKMKKVGHTGTLDPDVTGVLPICIGRATKIVEYITAAEKTYEGEVTLGYSTTTEDASGEVVSTKKVDRTISRADIEQVLQSMCGELVQTPPMFSAVKVNGKRLYEYARAGIEVERPSRTIKIKEFVLLDDREIFEGEQISFRFRVTCSKGTYVRTLAVMIGEQLGYPSHMSDLMRTASGQYTIDHCLSFEEIEEMAESQILEKNLQSIESALFHLPKYKINDTVAVKVMNGAVLEIPTELQGIQNQPICIIDKNDKCLALYARHQTKNHLMKPVKVLAISSQNQ
ncbi:tRNA pseudouridine(55) synthase TruB [Bacillus sp. PS06]|uniref:tRNA pseudouridine(55) synthase TruB n=1 Tax=Bacillus sp. PS06 TaxID=2764176 RepID=UPI00177F544C|nr:tRNA pseudouridine(55) synthase TruB [Bacillus sp. PS06]MBD8068256.1 tRNA pseudouridine(55) synthase TruB [Bacillus sp. PS06]